VRFGAVDADVCKTYVEMGLGVAIMATVAVDPVHDINLRARDASHLFESSPTYVTMRRNTYLRSYVSHFIGLLAPELTPELIRSELRGHTPAAKPVAKAGAAKRRQADEKREEKK
jgi:LysR family cys regulon transcriptional activator